MAAELCHRSTTRKYLDKVLPSGGSVSAGSSSRAVEKSSSRGVEH